MCALDKQIENLLLEYRETGWEFLRRLASHSNSVLVVDPTKEKPIPYATGYSTEVHTGWYVMPEEGDTVQVIFPTENENQAYAVQSAR